MLLLLPLGLQDEAFGDFVARVGFAALRQYAQGYVPADKSDSLASVSSLFPTRQHPGAAW